MRDVVASSWGKECVRRLAIAIGLIVLYLGRRSVEDFERWLEFFVQGVATNICRQFFSSFSFQGM